MFITKKKQKKKKKKKKKKKIRLLFRIPKMNFKTYIGRLNFDSMKPILVSNKNMFE